MATSKTWKCVTCNVDLADRHAVMGHLKTAHNETSDNPQGVRRMKSHLDARDWYSSVYEWTFDNGAVLESVQRSTRTKATRMY